MAGSKDRSSFEVKAHDLFNGALGQEARFNFERAKEMYLALAKDLKGAALLNRVRERLAEIDGLIAEKRIYERIHRNGKRVLSEIGVDVAQNPQLMDLLLAADAVDFDNESAIFIPIKADYIDRCLDKAPRKMRTDPGPNAFGTGATPPFLKRPENDDLRPANRHEFEQIVKEAANYEDVVKIFSLPVATDRSVSGGEVARLMDREFSGLKMTATCYMTDDEARFLKGKDDWLDGTSLVTALGVMKSMVDPFLRSVRLGNNLLLLDLTIAGVSGPVSPEALLTQIHAQVLFMMVLAQTLSPGISCVHGGIPDVVGPDGDLSYSSPSQPLLNAAMARVNLWVTGFPTAQSGGSTSLTEVSRAAIDESELSRDILRKYGVHIVRHAMGALGSLNFFSLEKFTEDCRAERVAEKRFRERKFAHGVFPLYFPADDQAFDGIREIAEKGNPKSADHTLKNVDAYMKWEKVVDAAAKKRVHYPDLDDNVSGFEAAIL